jgi:hypothetical protein
MEHAFGGWYNQVFISESPLRENVAYATGELVLDPRGSKEFELTKAWTTQGTIVKAEAKRVVLTVCGEEIVSASEAEEGDLQRFRLSEGDIFWIPPWNQYGIDNFSHKVECEISWTFLAGRNTY